MAFIYQSRYYDPSDQTPPGNCFQACVATIFGLALSEVPDEADSWKPGMSASDSWRAYWPRFCKWLQARAVGYVEIRAETFVDHDSSLYVPCIASGPSPRDPSILHAVVIQYKRIDRRTVGPDWLHDPHPAQTWLADKQIETVGYFCSKPPKLVPVVEGTRK